MYVDDLVLAYSSEAIRDKVICHLTERLPIDDRGELEWVLRLQVTRDREARAITISQPQYIDQLLENHERIVSKKTPRPVATAGEGGVFPVVAGAGGGVWVF